MANKKTQPDFNLRIYKDYFEPDEYQHLSKMLKVWPSISLFLQEIFRIFPLPIIFESTPISVTLIKTAIHHFQKNENPNLTGIDCLNQFVCSFVKSLDEFGHVYVLNDSASTSILDVDYHSLNPKIVNIETKNSNQEYIKKLYEKIVPKPLLMALDRFNFQPLSQYRAV